MYNNLKIGYNIYDVLYIDYKEKKSKVICDKEIKDFRHKTYKNKVIFDNNIENNKVILNIKNHINIPLSKIRSYDKLPIPINENILPQKRKFSTL